LFLTNRKKNCYGPVSLKQVYNKNCILRNIFLSGEKHKFSGLWYEFYLPQNINLAQTKPFRSSDVVLYGSLLHGPHSLILSATVDVPHLSMHDGCIILINHRGESMHLSDSFQLVQHTDGHSLGNIFPCAPNFF
jgi:hypothetical protein